MTQRRAIPRNELLCAMPVAKAAPEHQPCRHTIMLDGKRYRCGRAVRCSDASHDGIHDAFAEHAADSGAVRW